MHCRDCGAELLSTDPTDCRSCGVRPAAAFLADDHGYGPGPRDATLLRAIVLVAGLGAALALAGAVLDAAI